MKYEIKGPRHTKGGVLKDSRDFCRELRIVAQDDMDELALAAIADGIVYKNDKKFLAWLKERLANDMKRLKLAVKTASLLLLITTAAANPENWT